MRGGEAWASSALENFYTLRPWWQTYERTSYIRVEPTAGEGREGRQREARDEPERRRG